MYLYILLEVVCFPLLQKSGIQGTFGTLCFGGRWTVPSLYTHCIRESSWSIPRCMQSLHICHMLSHVSSTKMPGVW